MCCSSRAVAKVVCVCMGSEDGRELVLKLEDASLVVTFQDAFQQIIAEQSKQRTSAPTKEPTTARRNVGIARDHTRRCSPCYGSLLPHNCGAGTMPFKSRLPFTYNGHSKPWSEHYGGSLLGASCLFREVMINPLLLEALAQAGAPRVFGFSSALLLPQLLWESQQLYLQSVTIIFWTLTPTTERIQKRSKHASTSLLSCQRPLGRRLSCQISRPATLIPIARCQGRLQQLLRILMSNGLNAYMHIYRPTAYRPHSTNTLQYTSFNSNSIPR